MGYFRTKKIDRYSYRDLVDYVRKARCRVREVVLNPKLSDGGLDNALREWGEWREALARKEGENKSPLDK